MQSIASIIILFACGCCVHGQAHCVEGEQDGADESVWFRKGWPSFARRGRFEVPEKADDDFVLCPDHSSGQWLKEKLAEGDGLFMRDGKPCLVETAACVLAMARAPRGNSRRPYKEILIQSTRKLMGLQDRRGLFSNGDLLAHAWVTWALSEGADLENDATQKVMERAMRAVAPEKGDLLSTAFLLMASVSYQKRAHRDLLSIEDVTRVKAFLKRQRVKSEGYSLACGVKPGPLGTIAGLLADKTLRFSVFLGQERGHFPANMETDLSFDEEEKSWIADSVMHDELMTRFLYCYLDREYGSPSRDVSLLAQMEIRESQDALSGLLRLSRSTAKETHSESLAWAVAVHLMVAWFQYSAGL